MYICIFFWRGDLQWANSPFLQGMTFHTQSKNRNKIKRDIGGHILNDLNINKKKRENLKATHPTIFWEWHWLKSANDSLRDDFILMSTHTT